jgi:hypothetical protein
MKTNKTETKTVLTIKYTRLTVFIRSVRSHIRIVRDMNGFDLVLRITGFQSHLQVSGIDFELVIDLVGELSECFRL